MAYCVEHKMLMYAGLLLLLLGERLGAQTSGTFRFTTGAGGQWAACHHEDPNDPWKVSRACTPDDTAEDLRIAVEMEYSCASPKVRITLYGDVAGATGGLFDVHMGDGKWRTMSRDELTQRAGHYDTDSSTSREFSPVVQHRPIDVAFVAHEYGRVGIENMCGSIYYRAGSVGWCKNNIRTSGKVRWSRWGATDYARERYDPKLLSFEIERDVLDAFLVERRERGEAYDRGESGKPEHEALQILVWAVENPRASLRTPRESQGRYGGRYPGGPPSFIMPGRALASDGFHIKNVGFSDTASRWDGMPEFYMDELNRLQAVHDRCGPAPPPRSGESLAPEGMDALRAVRRMRDGDPGWESWKGVSLEEFAGTDAP